jgi:Uma2 family endonuclease
LVEVWCLEHDIEFTTLGNWTQQDERVARAVEPDECWVFGESHDEGERPDLAIEVIWTSGSIKKLEIYRKLAVREVWIWRRGELTAHALRDEMYEPVSESRVLPGIDLRQIAALLDQSTTSAAIRAYRKALHKG